MSATVRAVASRAARDAAYLTLGGVTGIIGLVVWTVGVSVAASLAILIIGVPVLVAAAAVFRWTAELDRRNAAWVLGRPLRARYRDHGGAGLWSRAVATARDPQTWRDLAWLVVHSILGLVFGIVAVTLIVTVAGLAALPAWYWSLPDGAQFGLWNADTLGKAFASAPLAIPLAGVTVGLLRGMALAEAGLASLLLGPAPGGVDPASAAAPARPRRDPVAVLWLHAALAALVGFVVTVVWGLTGAGTFWPIWPWLGLAASVGLDLVAVRATGALGDPARAFRARAELCAVIELLCLAVWAAAGGGYLWPVWPALGMGVALGVHAAVVFRHRLPWVREQRLVQRVDELTRTRRGALDVQAAELRRIERDLHDGAQARLVSLSMLMGRAEEHLGDRPEVADLVRQARAEAGAAIGELRDLARGIAPPVLADRGLPAAVQALAVRAPMEVTVHAGDSGRPPPAVETAAYFVVAEALTNVAKHAGGAPAQVTIARDPGRLVVEVADAGPGGADAAGSGLTGLLHRIQALDGTLAVRSAAGAGTTIRAELPCAS